MNLTERRQEFRQNVWNHVEDPLQLQFDVRRVLSPTEIEALQAITLEVKRTENDATVADFLQKQVREYSGDLTALLLQICGLTRSKIVTDLKAAGAGLSIPSSYKRLHQSPSWQISGPYLAASLRRVLRPLASAEDEGVYEALNQATYPGYVRQERAKRSGHEAEYRLAVLLRDVGLPFAPTAKSENKPNADVMVRGTSFDLVSPSVDAPKVVVMSAVHASNIGQYGESKANDVAAAKAMMQEYDPASRPLLLALIDGVGFYSNRAGLDSILSSADEFCQFSTLWKADVVVAAQLGRSCSLYGSVDYFAPFQEFLSRYPARTSSARRPDESVEAGRASLIVR